MPSDEQRSRRALSDIVVNVDLAQDFASGLDAERLTADRLRLYAVVRCLEIISEASRRLSPQIRDRHPELPWQRIAAAGNIYRHEYDGVSPSLVWVTVARDLPRLRLAMLAELATNVAHDSRSGITQA